MLPSISRRSLILLGLSASADWLLGSRDGLLGGAAARAADALADETPALNRALARGGLVQLAANRIYRTTGPLEIPTGASLVGDRSSVIAPDGDFPAIVIKGSSSEVRGITVRGDRERYRSSANHGVFVDWRDRRGSAVRISGVRIEDVAGSAVIALASPRTRSSGLTVNDCETVGSGAHGIIAQDYIDDVAFERNRVEGTGLIVPDRPGITASRHGRRIVVRNNVCIGAPGALGNSVHGISIDICEDAECTGNTVSGWVSGYGIEAGGIAGGQIAFNRVSGGRYGIALSGVNGDFSNRDLTIANNVIEDMSAVGIYAFIHGADGRAMHRRITLRSNHVRGVTGRDIGIGAYLMDIDGLTIDGLTVTGCRRSGVAIVDCPNHSLNGIESRDNNPSGDLAHAGLAVHWRRVPVAGRGTNRMSGNRIEANGGGRDLVIFER
jgi:hypothetical protein